MTGIIFNGVSSVDLDVAVLDVTPAARPEKRVTRHTVPGRDGILTVSDGTYENIAVRATLVILNKDRLGDVIDWLTGSGDLITYVNPDRKYRAEVQSYSEVVWHSPETYLMEVVFDCYPMQFEASPETLSATDETITLYNPATVDALPTITFDGTIVVNGTTFTAATELTVDVEMMLVYKYVTGVLTAAGADLTGDIEYMRLAPGSNTIAVTGTATITPNWRWL